VRAAATGRAAKRKDVIDQHARYDRSRQLDDNERRAETPDVRAERFIADRRELRDRTGTPDPAVDRVSR